MKKDNLIILEYQEDFCENFTSFAYGKILENRTNAKCFYENNPSKRNKFELKMKYFNIETNFISTNRVKSITKKALNYEKIDKIKNKIQNCLIDLKHFRIRDLNLITDEIKEKFNFSNNNFIISYDILEDIESTQSVGLYISEEDLLNNKIDFEYIYNATKRINKYIKKPKLFIFAPSKIKTMIKSDIDYKIVNYLNWSEEFYLLKQCKHKIIPNYGKSYTKTFWASVLNSKYYSINTYSKKEYNKNINKNWISI